MLYKFGCALLLLFSHAVFADNNSETESFIDRGESSLPVAPEVSKKLQEAANPLKLPDSITEKKNIPDEKQVPATQNIPAPVIEEKKDKVPTIPITERVNTPAKDEKPSAPLKPITDPIKPPPQVVIEKPAEVKPAAPKLLTPQAPISETKKPKNISPKTLEQKKIIDPAPKKIVDIAEKKKNNKEKKQHVVKTPMVDPLQQRFINDELLLMKFPDDDVVAGQITHASHLENISGHDYIKLFEKNAISPQDSAKEKEIRWFILEHSEVSNPIIPAELLYKSVIDNIRISNLSSLRVLAENYDVMDMVDRKGNGLLHIATFDNNPSIAKWLIMKGIDIDSLNNNSQSALDISENKQYWTIYNLLEKAGAEE